LARELEDQSPSLAGINVLLVDDEPDAREVMASALEACGATVLSAASAADALHTLRGARVDVLLADLAMPGTDGYDLIREVRSQSSEPFATVPAAAVTASARDDERQRALDAGFHLHLAKPVRPAALAMTVATLARIRPSTVDAVDHGPDRDARADQDADVVVGTDLTRTT
jgi:CheY-like chemotaxis protein